MSAIASVIMADNFVIAFYVMQLREKQHKKKSDRKEKESLKELEITDMCAFYAKGLEKEKTKIVNRKDDGYLRT